MHCCLRYETRQVLVEEPNRLNILNCDLYSCQFVFINFRCVFIYLISFLPCFPCAPSSIHFFGCYSYLTLEFCAGERRLITQGGICTSLGVILIRYARYILALRVHYVRYTMACSNRFKFARHFESHLARPPPFYMRMQTRRLPLNIPLLLCYTVHVLYSQPIRLR